MVETHNACAGCETCIGCGRDKDYSVVVCDCCGAAMEPSDRVYCLGDEHYCQHCVDITSAENILEEI